MNNWARKNFRVLVSVVCLLFLTGLISGCSLPGGEKSKAEDAYKQSIKVMKDGKWNKARDLSAGYTKFKNNAAVVLVCDAIAAYQNKNADQAKQYLSKVPSDADADIKEYAKTLKKLVNDMSIEQEKEKRKQAQEANEKRLKDAARKTAKEFLNAFFDKDFNGVNDNCVYSGQTSIQVLKIATLDTYNKIMRYLNYNMKKKNVNSFRYSYPVTIRNVTGDFAYMDMEITIEGKRYLYVQDVMMTKRQDGKLAVDLESFINEVGRTIKAVDPLGVSQ